MNRKGISVVYYIIIAVVSLVIIGGGFYAYNQQKSLTGQAINDLKTQLEEQNRILEEQTELTAEQQAQAEAEKERLATQIEELSKETCRDVQVPYDAQESYPEQEPYTEKVCTDSQVPYTTSEPNSQILISQQKVSVPAGSYVPFQGSTDITNKNSNIISGTVTETSGYDINFFVFNQQNFNAWKSGQTNTKYISLNKISSSSFSFVPDKTDIYYFVLDNGYSIFRNKLPQIDATWSYSETVTRTRTETTCEDVTKFRTVTKTRTVTKYRTETVCE